MPPLVEHLSAERAVIAQRIETLNITANGTAPQRFLDLLSRIVSGIADANDRKLLEQAMLAGGSCDQLAFPSTSIVIEGGIGTLNQTTQVVEAGALQTAIAAHQRQIDSDLFKSSLQAYMLALRSWTTTSPYRLPNQPAVGLDELYVPTFAREHDGDGVALPTPQIVGRGIINHPDRPVLVVGDAGSGKSAYLRHLARYAWDDPQRVGLDRPYLVMPIRIRAFSADEASVEKRLWRALGRSGDIAVLHAEPPAGFLTAWSKAVDARWLLLLDGLDEASRDMRADAIEWVLQLCQQAGHITPILTCRGYAAIEDTRLSKVAMKVALEPLSKRQKAEIGQKWLRADPEPFLREIRRTGLAEETNIPLVATLAAALFGASGRLPDSRTAIFEAYVELSVKQAERVTRSTHHGISNVVVYHALQTLAASSLNQDSRQSDHRNAESLLASFVGANSPALSPIEREENAQEIKKALLLTGLVVLEPTTQWLHASLRDYLAAKYLSLQHSPTASEARGLVCEWQDEARRNSLIFLFALWSEAESQSSSGLAPATSRLLESIIYGVDAPAKGSTWVNFTRWFASSSVKTRSIENREALRFAIEAVAEMQGVTPTIIVSIVEELAKDPKRLIMLNACARVFTGDRDELGALMRWRGRPALLRHLEPVLQKLEDSIPQMKLSEASGALAFLAWIGREDRLRAIVAERDMPPTAIFGALSRLAGEDQDLLVTSLFETLFNAWIERAIRLTHTLGVLTAVLKELSSIIPAAPAESQRRAKNAALPSIMRDIAAMSLLHNIVTGSAPKTETKLRSQVADVTDQLPANTLQQIDSFYRQHPDGNLVDMALSLRNDDRLKQITGDGKVSGALRAYVTLYRTTKPAFRTMEELRLRLLVEVINRRSIDASIQDAVSTLRRIDRLDLMERYACDDRLPASWSAQFIGGLSETRQIELGSELTLSLDTHCRVWKVLAGSRDGVNATLGRQRFLEDSDKLIAAGASEIEGLRRARADFLLLDDRYSAAETELTLLIELRPDDPDLYCERGYARYRLDSDDAALADFNKSISLNPRHAKSLYRKGRTLRYLRRYRESIEAFSLSIRAGNQSIGVFEARAKAFYGLAFPSQASADWKTAYGSLSEVNDADARAGYASALVLEGNYVEAMPVLRALAPLTPDDAPLLDDLARCLIVHGEYQQALEVASRAVALDGSVIPYRFVYALAARLSGGEAESLPEFSSIVEDVRDDSVRFLRLLLHALIANDRAGLEGLTAFGKFDPANATEAQLRWAVWEIDFVISQLPSDELSEMGLGAIKPTRKLLTGYEAPPRPENPDAPEKAESTRPTKPTPVPDRLPVGLLCGLYSIRGFEQEMRFAKEVLAGYRGTYTLFVFELEDKDSIYGQCNFKIDAKHEYDFKFAAPFRYVATNLFSNDVWISPNQVKRIVFDDPRTMGRFMENAQLSKYKAKFMLRPDTAPEGASHPS